MKKVLQILLCFVFLFGYTGLAEDKTASGIEKIEIVAEKTEFEPQDEYTFKVKTYPETETAPKIVWSIDKYFIAPIVPEEGFIVAVFPGEATITAQLADNPEIKATLDIKVLGDNTEMFRANEASIMVPENLYIRNEDISYKYNMSLFSATGGLIPENLGGVGWSQYYYVEYADNFKGKKGITRDGSYIKVAKDAAPAEDLYISVTVKRIVDDEVIITAESNRFDVKGKIKVSSVNVNGKNLKKSQDGKYYCETKATDEIAVLAKADRNAFYSYQTDGGLIKRTGDGKINISDLPEGEHTVVVYVFGENKKAAAGYSVEALAETIVISLTK